MADPFAALAHPIRRTLVDELRAGPKRAGELGRDAGVSREAVSKHLRLLVDGGVLVDERRGRERWYALEPSGLEAVDRWLEPYRAFWSQRLDALATEVARGRRERPEAASSASATPTHEPPNHPQRIHEQRSSA